MINRTRSFPTRAKTGIKFHQSRLWLVRLGAILAGVAASAGALRAASSVTLAWDQNPETNIVGYSVYYGTNSQAYSKVIQGGKVTTQSMSNLVAGLTYYFAVTAYNSLGLESVPSNEISYLVPAGTNSSAVPPRIAGIRPQSGRTLLLEFSGIPGVTYEVQASTNLQSWLTVTNFLADASGAFRFTERNMTNAPKRFYRLKSPL
jgi:hypothetical protein